MIVKLVTHICNMGKSVADYLWCNNISNQKIYFKRTRTFVCIRFNAISDGILVTKKDYVRYGMKKFFFATPKYRNFLLRAYCYIMAGQPPLTIIGSKVIA